ncbi:sigma-70 family RNA polymerase sigma factor [Streptomyces halobius]|uniref:Sigma-70 family RNA polymerase sigma factor n=1 Tax=Streptomyces halobius TaxID=2879846 RepID=A0ABY4MJZ3_9ACTN|nr:sigma-70 family RNA polymerase sigma factor [Streptomyces halobius]UQA97034.1 sigma-70 family RNA polymerase sigma factor [Streptomyces halobius]
MGTGVGAERECGAAVVAAARNGDEQARERLIAEYLPLVYNVVGRALDGHVDVDDVVQETMLRMLDGLGDLRDPAAFRSWLVAITMNQVRRRWADHGRSRAVGLDQALDVADPGADFVDTTIWRLRLSGQRREAAEATRWLNADDRELLSLWWLEAAGEIARSELAAALDITPRHAAVRVQRVKEQLETGRLVVRALAATPRCPGLETLIGPWDEVPSALWRKRIARHIRNCRTCSRHSSDMLPTEGLLAGLGLVPVLQAPAAPHSLGDMEETAASSPDPTDPVQQLGADEAISRPRRPGARDVILGGTAALLVAAAAFVLLPWLTPDEAPAAPDPTVTMTPTTTPSPPAPSASPATPPPTTAPPTTSPPPTRTAPASRPPSLEQQVTRLVNAQRERNGCRPVQVDAKLHTAAQRHADDMAARDYYQHVSPDGAGPDARISAAGYAWSRWGENLHKGPTTAARVMADWMSDAAHRDNILDCAFTHIGVGVNAASDGPWWIQDFAAH